MTGVLEKMARVIADASEERPYELFDYSRYPEVPGGVKAHVARNRRGGIVFESDDRTEAASVFDRLTRAHVARAALQAIREPDDAIVEAGWADAYEEDARATFTAMIDAILAEQA